MRSIFIAALLAVGAALLGTSYTFAAPALVGGANAMQAAIGEASPIVTVRLHCRYRHYRSSRWRRYCWRS